MKKEEILIKHNILINELQIDKPMLVYNILEAMDEYALQQVKKLHIQNVSNSVCECPQLHAVDGVCTYCKKPVPKSKYRKAK